MANWSLIGGDVLALGGDGLAYRLINVEDVLSHWWRLEVLCLLMEIWSLIAGLVVHNSLVEKLCFIGRYVLSH